MWKGRSVRKTSVIPKLICRFSAALFQIPAESSSEIYLEKKMSENS